MDTILHILFPMLRWLGHSSVGTAIKESTWLFPALETVHIFGIVYLVGATTILDIRLLGVAFQSESITALHRKFFPWIWVGFFVQLTTGFLLFSSEPVKMAENKAFLLKMFLIAVAGVNALIYEKFTSRNIEQWKDDRAGPIGARIAALVSIGLWLGIITAGRWIAYV